MPIVARSHAQGRLEAAFRLASDAMDDTKQDMMTRMLAAVLVTYLAMHDLPKNGDGANS